MTPPLQGPVLVRHQGVLLAFAASATPHDATVYYDTFDLTVSAPDDGSAWRGFEPLELPGALRPAGATLLDVATSDQLAEPLAGSPIQVVSDQTSLYLFRLSTAGTLWVNRLTMVDLGTDRVTKRPVREVHAAWEVRFIGTGQADVAAGPADSQSYLAPDGRPYIAPAVELSMVRVGASGSLAVTLVPADNGATLRWQILTSAGSSPGSISAWSFPRDASGLFDLSGTTVDPATHTVPADLTFAPELDDDGTVVPLDVVTGLGALVYTKRERIVGGAGDGTSAKRSGRLLVTAGVRPAGQTGPATGTMTVDFAIAADGSLAPVPAAVTLGDVVPANTTLAFDGTAAVALADPQQALSLAGPFTVEAWIYPTAAPGGPAATIIGGASGASANSAAPTLTMTPGGGFALAFGTGSAAVTCATTSTVLARSAWQHVAGVFDGQQLALYLNGEPVATSVTGTIAAPSGAAIATIGGPAPAGFQGMIDEVRVWSAARTAAQIQAAMFQEVADPTQAPLAGYWTFAAIDVDGSVNPPVRTTPDLTGHGGTGTLAGARPVPSTAPVAPASTATPYVTGGLTTTAGFAAFLQPSATPALLDGGDGLVHLYFADGDGHLSVGQYDPEVSRAAFTVPWSADSEQGQVTFLALLSGPAANQSSIAVTAGQDGLCSLALADGTTRTETWNGVPSELVAFLTVLSGRAQSRPTDPTLSSGGAIFYDYAGTCYQARAAVGAGQLVAASTGTRLRLSEVAFAPDTGAATGTLTVSLTAGGWTGSVTQTWPAVPATVDALLAVLSGLATGFDYTGVQLSALPAYALAVEGGAFAVTCDPGQVTAATVTVAAPTAPGPAGSFAKVTISLTLSSGSTVAGTWDQVPRSASDLAAVLAGDDPNYDYAAHAAGAYAQVAGLIAVVTDQTDAFVADQQVTEALSDPMVVGGQYRVFSMGAAGAVPAFTSPAAILQGATAEPAADLSTGSRLFAVLGDGGPSNGVPATVGATAAAAMAQAGSAGGWIAQEPGYAPQLSGTNAIAIDVQQPTGSELATPGDLTMEAWVCVGDPAAATPQILHCHRQLDPQDPLTASEYGLGLRESNCLQFVSGTGVTSAGDLSTALTAGAFSVQLWVAPTLATVGTGTGTIWSLTAGGTTVATLDVAANGQLTVALGGQTVLTSTARLDGTWQNVSVVRDRSSVTLYVDGVPDGAPVSVGAPGPAATAFVVGGATGPYALEMQVNDARIWNRALEVAEVAANSAGPVPPDAPALVLSWPLSDGQGSTAANIATATGSAYNGAIAVAPQSNPLWLQPGVYYTVFATRLGLGAESVAGVASSGRWAHVAAAYRSGNGLQLGGADYADAGADQSLDLDTALSIEAWVTPGTTSSTTAQAVVSKWGTSTEQQSYELGLDAQLRPYLQVRGAAGELYTATGTPLTVGTAAHLVGTFSAGPAEQTGSEPSEDYTVAIDLYVNGVEVGHVADQTVDHEVSVNISTTRLNFGRDRPAEDDTEAGAGQCYFTGTLAGISLWGRALAASEVTAGGLLLATMAETTGMVSSWSFSELAGNVAYDNNDANNAVLSSSELWCRYPATATLALYGDGVALAQQPLTPSSLGSYGQNQFQIGAVPDGNGQPTRGFAGQLADVRIWSRLRTGQEISESLYRPLTGAEDGLAGYWPLDDGSGPAAQDATGHGNPGTLVGATGLPVWQPSSAPISTEPPEAVNVLGGVVTSMTATVSGAPAVADYPESRVDAYGTLNSVMMRALAYRAGETVGFAEGFWVGDLEQRYLGQVQTDATLVGYIEGPPPLPSENLTRPLWANPTMDGYIAYMNNSGIALTEADESVRVVGSTKSSGTDVSLDARAGLLTSAEVAQNAVVLWFKSAELRGHAAARGTLDYSSGTEDGTQVSHGSLTTTSVGVTLNGDWETADGVLNPNVGRRWLPDSSGLAVVRSMTANLYALRVKGTGALVALTTIPDLDIPADVNFIEFPLNPRYVKNGTLDGKIGAMDDPSYPDADVNRGSFFKPLEAYRLKRQVERDAKALEAYYTQFDAKGRGKRNDPDMSKQIDDDPWYDWNASMARRSIANTYIWTSNGGMYKEQEQFSATRTESVSGSYHLAGKGGVHLDGEGYWVVGFYAELDFLAGGHVDVTVMKSKADSAAFSMDVDVACDGYLSFWDGSAFQPGSAPGKVDAYRFMSAYLAPSMDNASAFFDTVVDPNWLANGTDDYAVALRGAQGRPNAAWRLLHRVTYVRRVPPQYEIDPVQTPVPAVVPPNDVPGNALLIDLVTMALDPAARLAPTPAQLGAAVATVLSTSLTEALPWWATFLRLSQTLGSAEEAELRRLRHDLLAYMVDLYAAAEAEPALDLPVGAGAAG